MEDDREVIGLLAEQSAMAMETDKVWLSAWMNSLTEQEALRLTTAARRLVRAGNKRLRG